MRLIYIANIRLPTEKAHGIQIMKMCEAFADQGVKAELLIPNRKNDLGENPFEFYGMKESFKITKIPCLDMVSFDVARIGFLISTLSFLILTKIYLFFQDYDILYTREQLVGLFFKNFFLEVHILPERIGYWYKYLLGRSKKILVLTNLVKADFFKLGIPKNKVLTLPDAVNLKEFNINISKNEARKKLNLPIDKKIILYTGSFLFYDWKGIDVLLKSAQFLPANCLLALIGGHPLEIEKIKKEYNLDKIVLIPYVRHQIIPYYLKSADALVIPNKTKNDASEKSTSPLKLFEYMAAERPILSSDLPSLREVLDENEALFFQPDDPGAIAAAISKILSDEALGAKLTRNAYIKVQRYTWERRAKAVINLL